MAASFVRLQRQSDTTEDELKWLFKKLTGLVLLIILCFHILGVLQKFWTGSQSRTFCPTPDVQLDQFFHHTPKLCIPVEMIQFLWKRIQKLLLCTTIAIDFNSQISFPLCWGVGVGNFGNVVSRSRIFLLRNPDLNAKECHHTQLQNAKECYHTQLQKQNLQGPDQKKFFWEVKTKDTNFALNGLPVKIISCYCTRFMQMLSELHRKNDQQTNRNHVNT